MHRLRDWPVFAAAVLAFSWFLPSLVQSKSIFDDDPSAAPSTPPVSAPRTPATTPPPPPAANDHPTASPPAPASERPARNNSLEKRKVPGPADRAKILKVVKDIYREEYAERATARKIALAKELLSEAEKIEANFSARYVLLDEAQGAAIAAGDVADCRLALEQIGREYDIDVVTTTVSAMRKLADRPIDDAPILHWAADEVERLLSERNFDGAKQVSRALSSRAARSGDTEDRDKLKTLDAILLEADRVRPSFEKLKTSPDDPAANLVAGRFVCFALQQWESGLPMLMKGADARLADLARQDAAAPDDSSKQFELAGQWWDLSLAGRATPSQRMQYRSRAGYWYAKADLNLSGLNRVTADKRLEDISKDAFAHQGETQSLVFESYIDGNTEIHLTPRGIYLKVIDHVAKPGTNDNHDDPTYLNGAIWKLRWKIPDQLRGPDETELLAMPIGRPNFNMEWVSVGRERGVPERKDRTPPSIRTEKDEQIVWIPDPESGARWYVIRLTRR